MPLRRERVNSFTREILQEGGMGTVKLKIPQHQRDWGFKMEKCWFSGGAHKLELGAVSKIQKVMAKRVCGHNTSPSRSEKLDWCRTSTTREGEEET